MQRKNTLLWSFLASLVTACTTETSFKTVKPAELDIPGNIKRVAVVDRTIPENAGYKILNVLGGLMTDEGLGTARDAVPFALKGCNEALGACYRYDAVIPPIQLKGTGLSAMPSALLWDTVGHICRRNQVQGLLVLEAFDVDYKRTDITDTATQKRKNGEVIKTVSNRTIKELRETAGWRFYDPINKNIMDEKYVFADSRTEKGYRDGGYLYDAEKRDMAKGLAYGLGVKYAERITPHWVTIRRYYYTTGTDNMKLAARQAALRQWAEAAAIWQKELNNPKQKIQKRAYYNMIVANEMIGKNEIALDWANQSYQKFGTYESKTYVDRLKESMYDDERVRKQLGEDYSKLQKQ